MITVDTMKAVNASASNPERRARMAVTPVPRNNSSHGLSSVIISIPVWANASAMTPKDATNSTYSQIARNARRRNMVGPFLEMVNRKKSSSIVSHVSIICQVQHKTHHKGGPCYLWTGSGNYGTSLKAIFFGHIR